MCLFWNSHFWMQRSHMVTSSVNGIFKRNLMLPSAGTSWRHVLAQTRALARGAAVCFAAKPAIHVFMLLEATCFICACFYLFPVQVSLVVHCLVLYHGIIMGRKGNFDLKEKKGPGRKARKQGEASMRLFIAKTTPQPAKRNADTPTTPSLLKRYVPCPNWCKESRHDVLYL